MKKLLPVSLVVLILAVGGGAVYFSQRPGGLSGKPENTVAAYLPAETLMLFALPDPGQTATDWRTTDLYKIWTEPQVQAFLAKPLSKIPVDKDFTETLAQIQRLDPKNLFVALTALDEKNSQPRVVAGFQFKGETADVDRLLTKPKAELRQKFPGGKADLINYQGHALETFDTCEGNVLTSGYTGNWYLVGNDLALLKTTFDRVDHRATSDAGTLEKQADFQAVSAKLPRNFATLIFARPQVFIGKAYALAAASGQTIDPARRAETDKLKAVGATTTIEKGKIRDTVYTLAPGLQRTAGNLQRSALPLTSPDTLLYLAQIFEVPAQSAGTVGAPAPGSPSAGTYAVFGQFSRLLEQAGLSLEQLQTAFGREGTLQLDWPANSPQPGLIVSLDVRDKGQAGKFVEALTGALSGAGEWQTLEDNGLTLRSLTLPTFGFVSPTFTVTDKHLVFGLSAASVRAAADREKTGGANFTTGEAYKSSAAAVAEGNTTFGYLDSRAFFERLYGALKPMALLGTTLLYPQANDYVELGKLPDAETISKHLSPVVLSQSADGQGVLVESVGPVTFIQAGVGLGGLSAAAAAPMLQKQLGNFGLPTGASGDAADAPEATPEGTPSETP